MRVDELLRTLQQVNTNNMKRLSLLFALSVIYFVNLVFCCYANAKDEVEDKISIEIQTIKDKNDYERDLFYNIQVYYYVNQSSLEITCYNEGMVMIYLFNSRNQLCGYSEFNSSETPFERLDVPKQAGTYHVAIITDRSYSEGSFVK